MVASYALFPVTGYCAVFLMLLCREPLLCFVKWSSAVVELLILFVSFLVLYLLVFTTVFHNFAEMSIDMPQGRSKRYANFQFKRSNISVSGHLRSQADYACPVSTPHVNVRWWILMVTFFSFIAISFQDGLP